MDIALGIAQLQRHFPDLSAEQVAHFVALGEHYERWNAQLNLISRKDIHNLYTRHILHSLSIAKVISFLPKAEILDIGTGGGLPGVPLAILFPKTHFSLVDSIGKKVDAVRGIVEALALPNVTVEHKRAETLQGPYDFIIGRAVTALPTLYDWVKGKIGTSSKHPLPNGILYLKGGPLEEEIYALPKVKWHIYPIQKIFPDLFFETKNIVHLYPVR